MQKLDSTLRNMLLSLTTICVVAAAALAGVNMLTEDTIAARKEAAKQQAIADVLPPYATLCEAEEVDGTVLYRALDEQGQVVGVAAQTVTDGFGGKIKLMIGLDSLNHVVNYAVLEQTETPGLGTHIVEWFKNSDKPGQNIIGREANGKWQVSKDGGDIDAITAATISSRAFLKSVNIAFEAANGGDVNALSGASRLQPNVEDDAQEESETDNMNSEI